MLTKQDFKLIRRKHYGDGMSGRAIARELGFAPQTVSKAINNPQYPRCKPILGPVIPFINAWLDEDQGKATEQRQSAQQIYERLCREHGFQGSYVSVSQYVRAARLNLGNRYNRNYHRLTSSPRQRRLFDQIFASAKGQALTLDEITDAIRPLLEYVPFKPTTVEHRALRPYMEGQRSHRMEGQRSHRIRGPPWLYQDDQQRWAYLDEPPEGYFFDEGR